MDVFNGVAFVRLRSIVRADSYMAADVDGVSVCLTRQRAVHNTVWAVDHAFAHDGGSVLLRGAYGRYLVATNYVAPTGSSHAFTTKQASLQWMNPPPSSARWMPIRRRGGTFAVRCGLGRYLRANGRFLRWRREVTVSRDIFSSMLLWAIERVPLRVPRPTLIFVEDILQLTHKNRRPPTEREVTRDIRYARCEPNGDIDDAAWRTMQIRSNSKEELWRSLAQHQHDHGRLSDSTVCIRAGPFGRFTPLHIDLPIGTSTIDIVIVPHGTPAEEALNYAHISAPLVL